MIRFIISFLLLLMLITTLPGCSTSKKSINQSRGLMLLDNTQLGRNRTYYSRRDYNKMEKRHKKFHNQIKGKPSRKKR
jgi:hypothetical protein